MNQWVRRMTGMKFKIKFSELLLGLGTLLAIVTSIVLWTFIMTNDQRFSRIRQTSDTAGKQVTRTKNTKYLSDIYIPTSIFGFKNNKPYRLYDSKNNLSFEFMSGIEDAKVRSIRKVSQSQSSYSMLLDNPNFIQLTYPDAITFRLFGDFNLKGDNRKFNRIFISDSNNWLYAGNDQTGKLYRVGLKNANFDHLRKYAKKASYKGSVNFVSLGQGYSTFYDKAVKFNIYSYLINYQTDSYFVSRLLGNSGVSSRINKKGLTTYTLNYYTRLTVPKSGKSNNHNYVYTHYEKNALANKTPNESTRLIDSTSYVHQVGLSEQDIRFFDSDDDKVAYTNYIEGLPVFLNKGDLQVSTAFGTDSVIVKFNSLNLQIPIPFDGQTQTLRPTQEVLNSLLRRGMRQNSIQRIVVGYQVEKDLSHDNLINLIPTYYIKAYGEWKSASEWEKQNTALYNQVDSTGKGVN